MASLAARSNGYRLEILVMLVRVRPAPLSRRREPFCAGTSNFDVPYSMEPSPNGKALGLKVTGFLKRLLAEEQRGNVCPGYFCEKWPPGVTYNIPSGRARVGIPWSFRRFRGVFLKDDRDDRVAKLEEEILELRQEILLREQRVRADLEQRDIRLREMIRNLPAGHQAAAQPPAPGTGVTQARVIDYTGKCPTDPRYQCTVHGPGCPNLPK
jgi:hypothetical protein